MKKSSQIKDTFEHLLFGGDPFFLNRLGGSDFDAVARKKTKTPFNYLIDYQRYFDLKRVRSLNGFFDLDSKSTKRTYQEYLDVLDTAYKNSQAFTFGNAALIETLNTNTRETSSSRYLNSLVVDKALIPYAFIESITPFLESLFKLRADSKILVISPFSNSISMQLERRDQLLNGFVYPNWEFLTYSTPITYNNNFDIRNKSLRTRTSNWISELNLMKSEIRRLDFDLALLSCGSYAGPIGSDIASTGRKAIYLGGVLNVLFNIYGGRFQNDYYLKLANPYTMIEALETSNYAKQMGGRNTSNEAFRAYFK